MATTPEIESRQAGDNADAQTAAINARGLKRKALGGGAVTIASQVSKFLMVTGTTVIMARLLTPEDYGSVAIVVSALGFVALFRDLGLSAATVQKGTITHEESNGLFWINVACGVVLMLVMAAFAPLIAGFYAQPDLLNLSLAHAAMAPISSLGAQHAALMRRNMQFTSLAVRDIVSVIGGSIAGIVSAFAGAGVWALIIMHFTQVSLATITLWWKSSWRPGRPRVTRAVLPLVRFGGSMTVSGILAYFNRNLDVILLGRAFGPLQVGFYTRAHGILNKPLTNLLPPTMSVALPLFSRLRADAMQFERTALRLTSALSGVGGLIVVCIVPFSDWIVILLLGDQWVQAAPLVAVLGIFVLMEPMSHLMSTLLVASGHPGAVARWRAVSMLIIIAAFFAGLPWGPLGVAAAYSGSGILTRIWLVFQTGRYTGISVRRLFQAAAPFILVALLVLSLVAALRQSWSPSSAALGLIAGVAAVSVLYVAAVASFKDGRFLIAWAARELGSLARRRRQRPKPAENATPS